MELVPTDEQKAITDFVRNEKESLLVNALAGSAKTSTLVMSAHAMRPVPTLAVAFNKKIADEMARRLPSYITSQTLNSVGHRVWGQAVGHRLILETDKTYNILSELIKNLRKDEREAAGEGFASMLRSVRLAKSMGYIPHKFESLGETLVSEAEFEAAASAGSDVEPDETFWGLVNETLCLGITNAYKGQIDFDDQLYMSTCFNGNFPKYPVLMVDETQDLSLLNFAMLEKMSGGRVIAVGDRLQSIYGFRGAHGSAMTEMTKRFSMKELSLTISFRCPKAVVLQARSRAPQMQWPEWAVEGKVEYLSSWDVETPPDGSAVICRNNAPLFKAAMHFIRNGRGVKIVGNDIGAGLVKLLKKMGPSSMEQEALIKAIGSWRAEQIAKASKSRLGPINDRAECLLVFAEQGNTLSEAIAFAEHLFAASGPVQFLTGHKAKGLEYENVFFLDSFLVPSKSAKAQAEHGDRVQLEQELNLQYVIRTRSKLNLFYVNSEDLV